jgi:hypothetical protein
VPIATGLGTATGERFELKSLEGGFVVLRRMSYGERMTRKSFMSKVKLQQELSGSRAERRSKSAQGFMAEMDMANEAVTAFEFSVSIVDHNLEYDDRGVVKKLDFTNSAHVKLLDGRVGEEIDELIVDLNELDDNDEVGKSTTSSTTS